VNLISPQKTIMIGFFLTLLGVILPFLMVLRVMEPTFLLSFISWGSTVAGLFLGVIGAANYVRLKK
jgi:hypothetical protein